MATKHITTRMPWDSTPKRDSATRYVKRDRNDDAVKRAEKSEPHSKTARQGRNAELPPPGPSNIVVTTASILPPPREIASE